MKKTNFGALGVLTIVFFFWGFIAAGNSVFIPFCKNYFHLDQFQSQLVDYAFYGAYYLGALFLFIMGSYRGKDLVGNWGYKRSIVYGLLFSAFGAAAMIVAVYGNTFSGMLIGFFLVALGFSLQQTAANPFAISLGDPATGATRVNFTGGINSLGTMIGPLIVAFALFGSSASITDDMIAKLDLVKVIVLYLVVGILFILAATIFGISKSVPSGKHEEPMAPANKALRSLLVMTGLLIIMFTPVFSSYNSDEAKTIVVKEKTVELLKSQNDNHAEIALLTQEIKNLKKPLEQERMIWLSGALVSVLSVLLFANRAATKQAEGWGAMRYPQLVLGMLAIFIYVGVEVAIGSNLGELLKQKSFGGLEASAIAPYISMYWGSLMIGRWAGAVNAFELKKSTKLGLIFFVPLIAFAFIIAANLLAQKDVSNLYWYVLCVLIQVAAFFYVGENPIKSLLVFGGLGIVAMTVGMLSDGPIAIYAFLSGGLCCSILWPCIFSLSITGLGKYTSQGSAFLIMMILGGGIIPPLQGKLADVIGIQSSYIIAIFCFAYLAFFGWQVKRILNQQGITHFDAAGSGH
ncbi:MAG: MFS transporter [Flavobacteriales bacterium]|jgi:FHS family L-fucose permease-like MFS transporter